MFYHLQIPLKEDDSKFLIFWSSLVVKNEGQTRMAKSAKPDIIYIGQFPGSRTTELHTAKFAVLNVVLLFSNFGLPSRPHCVLSLADLFERRYFEFFDILVFSCGQK